MATSKWCILVFVLAGVLAPGGRAIACTCAVNPLPEAFAQADAVFIARVTNMAEVDYSAPQFVPIPQEWLWDVPLGGHLGNQLYVKLELVEAFKGDGGSFSFLSTDTSTASCGYPGFEVGTEFLIYARRHADKELTTSLCARTTPASGAIEEIRMLRKQYAE